MIKGMFSWTDWPLHPDLVIGLILLEGIYLLCVGPLRGYFVFPHLVKPTRGQITAFSLGVLIFFLADNGPMHELSENFLFSAHMSQHVLLTLVVPPLLLMGTPPWLLRPLLKFASVERVGRFLTHPVVAFALFNLVFALWHLPALYQATLRVHGFHILEHLLFLSTAVIMWWPIVGSIPELPRPSYPIRMLYLFLLPIAQLVVFAPITFSTGVLYPHYAEAPRLWSISPLADQQLGGVIMKVASSIIFLAALTIIFFRWFNQEEAMGRRQEEEREEEFDIEPEPQDR